MCRLQRDSEPYDVVIIVGKLGQYATFSVCREGRVGSGRVVAVVEIRPTSPSCKAHF